jgi:hypothetical protein
MSADVQKYRARIIIAIEYEHDIEVDMHDYAEWLDNGGEGDMTTYIDELIHDVDGSAALPNAWFEGGGGYHHCDVEDVTPIPELVNR